MTQDARPDTQSALTPEVRAMIGVAGDVVESWGTVDQEYLRRFTQAVMDPDPRYWDEEFAKNTHYGAIITPPIMVSYMTNRIRPDQEDPITRAFEENPESDGIGSVERPGALPPVPTNLVRVLNAGNELEMYQYPNLGDKIYFQNRYSDIRERVGREGNPFLIVTVETSYRNQRDELLCITRQSSIRR
jgi:hypothetical protein